MTWPWSWWASWRLWPPAPSSPSCQSGGSSPAQTSQTVVLNISRFGSVLQLLVDHELCRNHNITMAEAATKGEDLPKVGFSWALNNRNFPLFIQYTYLKTIVFVASTPTRTVRNRTSHRCYREMPKYISLSSDNFAKYISNCHRYSIHGWNLVLLNEDG